MNPPPLRLDIDRVLLRGDDLPPDAAERFRPALEHALADALAGFDPNSATDPEALRRTVHDVVQRTAQSSFAPP